MTPTYTKVGPVRFGSRSCLFAANGFPLLGIVGVSTKQKRVRKTVRSNIPGAPPLGRTSGLYSAPILTLKMLREDSETFAAYLSEQSGKALIDALGAYADAPFTFTAQCTEPSNAAATVTMLAKTCVITDRNTEYAKDVGALVDEYTIEALQISETDSRGQRFLYSTAPNALDALAQDFVTIEGQPSPGRATILDAKREIGWDVRQAWGLDRATLIPKGNPPATFSIRFDMWDEADLPKWNAYSAQWFKYATVRLPGSTTNYALSIKHPILQAQPIALQACVISKIHALNRDEDGLWGSTIEFLEYGKPAIAKQAATAQIAAAAKTQPTAKSARDIREQKALAELAAVANDRAAQIVGGAR